MTLAALSASTPLFHALDEYQAVFLTSRNLAPRTRKEYSTDLRQLLDFLQGPCCLTATDQIETKHLQSWFALLDSQEMKGSTRRRKYAAIRSFFAFQLRNGVIAHDPTEHLAAPEKEGYQPRVLTEPEYKRLQLLAAQDPSYAAKRNAAIIELLLQTGARLSEVAKLKVPDVVIPPKISREAEAAGAVRLQGKGRKERIIALNWKGCKAIRDYLQVRPEPKDDDDSLFLSKYRTGIKPRAIQVLIDKYLKQLGIANASVHTLRHTFGTHQVIKGTNLDVVREMMGHKDLTTTSIYVQAARVLMNKQLQENAL
jgi:site-specific recombinase XerD